MNRNALRRLLPFFVAVVAGFVLTSVARHYMHQIQPPSDEVVPTLPGNEPRAPRPNQEIPR